jgi:hypothetical protein
LEPPSDRSIAPGLQLIRRMPRTNNRLVNQIPQMIEGLERRFAGQTLSVNGVSITCAEAIAQLERVATARAATATARAA